MNYLKTLENLYLKNQKDKILTFAREMFIIGEIKKEQLQETYFNLYIKK